MKEYLTNNDQEQVFPKEEHVTEVETHTTTDGEVVKEPEKTERVEKDRYYASSIAPARRIEDVQLTSSYEDDYVAGGIIQFVYVVAGILNLLLGLRFLLKLFGAADTGVVQGLYNLTDPIVAPFSGIFGSTNVPQAGVFETESLLAIVAVTLVTWVLASLLRSLTRNVQA